jgi:hypothetical protein
MITKEQADALAKAEGKIKGVGFKSDAEYVKNKIGPEGVQKLKAEMEKLGYPIDYEKVKAMDWYPVGVRVLNLEVMKDLFGWDDEEIKKVGHEAPKFSLIMRLIMKYFINIERMSKLAPVVGYKKHFNIGEYEALECNLVEQYSSGRAKGLKILYDSAALTKYIEGYFTRGIEYVLPGKEVTTNSRKYIVNGIPHVEFRSSWK